MLSPAKALLSRHRCLPHPTADIILKSPLSTLSHHLSLHCRAAGSAILLALTLPPLSRCFHHCAAAPFIFVPSLPSSLCRQFCLCHHAAASHCFCHCAAAQFIVTPPLPSSLCRQFCLCRRATAAFFVMPLFPSLLRRRFFLRHRAATSSAFVVAPPLPSLSCRCYFRHCAAARFIVAPPLYFFF